MASDVKYTLDYSLVNGITNSSNYSSSNELGSNNNNIINLPNFGIYKKF